MTAQTLDIANKLNDEIKWCDEVMQHYYSDLKLTYEDLESCIELDCPPFLNDKIYNWVKDYKANLEEEFKKL